MAGSAGPGRRAAAGSDELGEPGAELRPEVVAVARPAARRRAGSRPVAGVVAAAAEDDAVHRPARGRAVGERRMASVSWISPPRPGGVSRSPSKIAGASTYRPMMARLLGASSGRRLLDQAGDADDVVAAGRLDRGAAVEVDLVGRHLHQGDDAAAVLLLHLDHPRRAASSRSSMRSSPSSTANGSSPTCSAAHSTAWPSPRGSPCRTKCSVGQVGGVPAPVEPVRLRPRRRAACPRARRRGRSGPRAALVAAGDHEHVVSPARTASSTTYWIAGLSTTGSISLGVALVAGRNRVPRPAAGITAFADARCSCARP